MGVLRFFNEGTMIAPAFFFPAGAFVLRSFLGLAFVTQVRLPCFDRITHLSNGSVAPETFFQARFPRFPSFPPAPEQAFQAQTFS